MKTTYVLIALLAYICIGCSPSVQVYSDYDRNANLEAYSTFGWLVDDQIEARNNPLYYNELNDKRIKTAVAEQLEARGYQFTKENPELLIHYHIIIEDKTVMRTDPYGYYYGPYWARSEVTVFEFREGTLIIDLMDGASKNLVWRGWMHPFLQKGTEDKAEAEIKTSVMSIFTKYPYRAAKSNEPIDY